MQEAIIYYDLLCRIIIINVYTELCPDNAGLK